MAAASPSPGASVERDGVRFAVWSSTAETLWLCLFDANDRETDRIAMTRDSDGLHTAFMPGIGDGQRYGLRADGPWDPAAGLFFDPAKLLVDPHALEIDRAYRYDGRLAAPRSEAVDTGALMPKAIVRAPASRAPAPPLYRPGGLIYEVNVRGFTMRHPDVPPPLCGTLAALRQPCVIDHLHSLHVAAVELMPVTAWMDERHLPPLGLSNAWGYNPVTFMALDPRLAPGGWTELRQTVEALREAGIGTILDLVFNHTAESDTLGPTLSLRGLDNRAYYRHDASGTLVNDTGTGNTLACDHPAVQRLVIDSLRAFVLHAGVDGFRFDLAPILGRDGDGFDPDAGLLRAIIEDDVLRDRVLVAEPWDIGPGGYQLGRFAPPFLEWNDRYRDDVRRFWRGDAGTVGALATRLVGSSDVFHGNGQTRSVNFIAAHDGMTLADLTAYAHKHNEANGEHNRDGHDENLSWNHGVEGESDDEALRALRRRDVKALLATLFVSRGSIMLTAGDEFGRTQHGNNNAYAQDNAIGWLDWSGRDLEVEAFAFAMARLRAILPQLSETSLLGHEDVRWLREDGTAMQVADWEDAGRRVLTMQFGDLAIVINGGFDTVLVSVPFGEETAIIEAGPRSVTVRRAGEKGRGDLS